MCPQFFIPNSKLLSIALSTESSVQLGMAGPTLPKARAPTPSLGGWIELERASGESCRRGRANPPGTPVGGPRPRAPPVLPGVADAGSKPHAAARVGKRGEMALHEGASLARAGSDARSICGAQGGGRRGAERCVGAGAEGWGARDAGGPPSATRATMLSVGVEERGPSPTSRRRRAACPPTPPGARA